LGDWAEIRTSLTPNLHSAVKTDFPSMGCWKVRTLGESRVLIVGWKPNSSQFLRSALASLGMPAFSRVSDTDEALVLMRDHGFELVFCTSEAKPLNPAERSLVHERFWCRRCVLPAHEHGCVEEKARAGSPPTPKIRNRQRFHRTRSPPRSRSGIPVPG
jgi:hypothetical protein